MIVAARSSSVFWFISHCHIVRTVHPASRRDSSARRSRSTLSEIFVAQNSARVAGSVARLQPSWPCQKQPCTKTTTLLEGNTRSGVPGNLLSCNLYLRPLACRKRRTAISGRVPFARMRDISSLRLSGVSRSIGYTGRSTDAERYVAKYLASFGGTALPIIRATGSICSIG